MFFAVDPIAEECIIFSENLQEVIEIAQDRCDEDSPEFIIFKAETYGKVYLPKQPAPIFTKDLTLE